VALVRDVQRKHGSAGIAGIRRLVGPVVPATGVDQSAQRLDQADGKRESGHQDGDETNVPHVRTIPA
jgi:HPt (histidine-containing phosphotransfer) domain-containing protein